MKLVRILAVVFAIGFALSASGIAWANTGAAMGMADATVTPEPTETPEPESDSRVAQAIADEFEVDVEEIIALHAEGLGYGEIVKAYALAEASGKTVEEILAMKEEGMGWGEIAQALEVKPGAWEPNLGELMRDSKPKDKEETSKDNPGNSGKEPPGKDKDDNGNGKGNGKENGKENGNGKNK